ncbi:MAG TPA: cytochrome P460 family protein [Bryobacteraceae bacterium]|nr:cytochrome P460 family protein [Bryobacteraceae bacterium]
MASRAVAVLLFLGGTLLSQEPLSRMAQPRYEGDKLLRPEGYREWIFVASNLGMGYTAGQPQANPSFHNIYMQPEAYRYYRQTGRFPDKTMLVMERYSAGTIASINRRGQFQDRLLGLEVALKDEQRFPEKWAYFDFSGSGGALRGQAAPFPKQACWSCHNAHGGADNVFVQFYPILRK